MEKGDIFFFFSQLLVVCDIILIFEQITNLLSFIFIVVQKLLMLRDKILIFEQIINNLPLFFFNFCEAIVKFCDKI